MAAAVLVLLLVLQHSSYLANGQGLSISNEAVGAGEAATAAEFSNFEEALLLASQTTGGRCACVPHVCICVSVEHLYVLKCC
jgi:hypothetical protein